MGNGFLRMLLIVLLAGMAIGGFLAEMNGQAIYGTREVVVSDDRSVVMIHAKMRFATLIVLPAGENIAEGYGGDKAFWQVTKSKNFVTVKPSRVGASSNLQILTDSGHVYSFLLTEVGKSDTIPDLKVFIRTEAPKPVAAPAICDNTELMTTKGVLEKTQRLFNQTVVTLDTVRAEADRKIDPAEFIGQLDDYRLSRGAHRAPFNIESVYVARGFTYIKAKAPERFAVYEVKDGKPNLVEFFAAKDVYVVRKVVDHGYVKIGTEKVKFDRRG